MGVGLAPLYEHVSGVHRDRATRWQQGEAQRWRGWRARPDAEGGARAARRPTRHGDGPGRRASANGFGGPTQDDHGRTAHVTVQRFLSTIIVYVLARIAGIVSVSIHMYIYY